MLSKRQRGRMFSVAIQGWDTDFLKANLQPDGILLD